MSSLLVIPTLNEIDGMKMIISKINKNWVDEIIVVDGGSTDGTIEEAKKLGFKVMMQKTKGSLGAAIFDAFEASNSDFLLMFGADGNNEVEEIPKMLKKKGGPAPPKFLRFLRQALRLASNFARTRFRRF